MAAEREMVVEYPAGEGSGARRLWTTERKIVGGFGAAVFVLCVVAGVSVWLTLTLLGGLNAVAHHVDVLQANGAFRTAMGLMSSAARLYAVEGSDKAFGDWDREQKDAMQKLADTRDLTDDATQRGELDRIRIILQDHIARTTRGTDGKTLQALWSPDTLVAVRDNLLAVDNAEQDYLDDRNREATLQAKAALWTIGLASLLALVIVGGAVALILRDLRGRRRAAEELQRARLTAEAANTAKSAFLANMSHELRTPLTSIIGYADLLLAEVGVEDHGGLHGHGGIGGGEGRREEYLQTLRHSGEHLLSLINDILDVSKIEAGRMTVEMVECRVVEVLAEVSTLMRPRAQAKGIAFDTDYATATPDRVMTDPTRLRQILVNLVGNAIKFTEKGGVKVVVSYVPILEESEAGGADCGHLKIDVVDTGVGISREQQKLLFQPFAQADVSTTRRFGGSGLGLSISLRLADMMDGSLGVESELGRGSTFSLILPALPLDGVMLAQEEARRTVGGIRRVTDDRWRQLDAQVLLAEDGVESQAVISLHLRRAGCRVSMAQNGEEAVAMALAAQAETAPAPGDRAGKANGFDVILMDMQMPVMDGYTATSKLRSEGYQGVIVALTAHAMKEDRERCIRVGCDEYAAKPVDIPALLNLIERLCGKRDTAAAAGPADRLRSDPVLRNLTRKFCEGTVRTMAEFMGQWERVEPGNPEVAGRALVEMGMLAHKLAGTAGAYGFDGITRDAKELERLLREGSEKVDGSLIRAQLDALEAQCAAARQGWAVEKQPAV